MRLKLLKVNQMCFKQQVQNLNLELTNEIANKTQLENNIRDLNNQLSANQNILSQKASELESA